MALADIRQFASRLRAYSKHVAEKIGTVTIGALFVSPPARKLRSAIGRFRMPTTATAINSAIIAHVYYPELLPEILACRAYFPGTVPLHITTTAERADDVRHALADQDGVKVHLALNRGRDIAPFLTVLSSGLLDGYDAVLKLHTKSSPHLWDGALRRKLLFQSLCGEKSAVLRTLAFFVDPKTAIVGWGPCFRCTPRFWFSNEMRVRELAARMEATDFVRPGFFEGSMFWFRPASFARLRALNLQADEFEPEAGQLDGTLHHAIERCFTIAAWASGYVVRDMRGRLLPRE